ncbi:hypothetical protein K493DRAFT_217947 [Basidiobolus meristosporus CBS 931.73]|uniref:Uncharacterized protein n=1 Tax=Basidiobolus meristosporus CBS 931.73 TaxID=1314790 RepID=A0A1Y1YDU0_9FUNG|nr:hypothetical protein K493DRAFT_217947 [Basidiobolus meristosporus CBS 931.73]|eukprot:ORX96211.1 hypothetical protein K493DRAFT_217947 [Basidiobolus meristosporus CBS 931.73]
MQTHLSSLSSTTTVVTTAALTTNFEEIQNELKKALDHIEQGAILKAFEVLVSITDVVVSNCEALGLTSDEAPFNVYDREGFWQGINHCWLYALSRTTTARSDKDQLRETHLFHLRDSVIAWCDILERYGLVDYEMGFWELDILEAIEASILAANNIRIDGNLSDNSTITTESV